MSPPVTPPSFPSPQPSSFSGESTSLSLLARLRVHPSSAAAWDRVVWIYRPLLRRWSIRLGLQEADADDLTQNVLVELHVLLPQFQHNGRPGAFRRWLKQILTRRVKLFWRQSRLWRRICPLPATAEFEAADSPLARLWDKEHDEHLLRCIWKYVSGSFSERDVEVFRRLMTGEEAVTAVAAQFGISIEAVYKIKSRILQKLRAELRGLVDFE